MQTILTDETKRLNAIRFINATRELIDTEGLEKLSVRKIAEKAGFHNSTIYLYFQDINQLILLASLKHFGSYSKELSVVSRQNGSPVKKFFTVWSFFAKTIFDKPHIFYNFFFGKHSDNLTEIITTYYELFPEEKEEYTKEIHEMYYARNITERCLLFLKPMISEYTSRITEKNLELVNDIIVSCTKVLLEEKCMNPDEKTEIFQKKLLDMIHYTVGL